MYDNMDYKQRNNRLKSMLDNETILIFPNDGN